MVYNNLKCIGGIIGDIVGKPFEFYPTKSLDFEYRDEYERPTDDSIMTLANMDWLVSGGDIDDYLRKWGNKYPRAGYGPSFKAWLFNPGMEAYGSFGNGSGMRVSPVGWFFNDIEAVIEWAEKSAVVTHNHPEGIKGAQCIAGCIWLARNGRDKDVIKSFCSHVFGYDMDRKLEDIRPSYKFEVSCQRSVPESVICFLEADSYEGAIRNAISLGGDADTQACMAGAISEAYGYKIPEHLSNRLDKCDKEMLKMINEFNNKLISEK